MPYWRSILKGLVVRTGDTASLFLSLADHGSSNVRALLFGFLCVEHRIFHGAAVGRLSCIYPDEGGL